MGNASGIVRAFPYPVLEDGNLSFKNGSYDVKLKSKSDTSIILEHQLENAYLLENLISQKKAEYGCLVAIPRANYRKLHLSSDSLQTIAWEPSIVAEPPMFKPIIVCTKAYRCKLSEKDGIAAEWAGVSIFIPKGARLALKRFFRHNGNIAGLLNPRLDSSFLPGSFQVEACDEEGFSFNVKMARDLYHFIQSPAAHSKQRRSIIIHIVSRCFEILANDYGRDNVTGEPRWQQFNNLKSLVAVLKDKNLSIWDEDDFAADKVATQYIPHVIPAFDIED